MAVSGQIGVEEALSILRREFDLSMALTGCTDIRSIKKDLLGDF